MTLPETGERIYRLPAWIRRCTQDLSVSPTYDAVFWNPDKPYQFRYSRPKKPESLRIYEAHGRIRKMHNSHFSPNICSQSVSRHLSLAQRHIKSLQPTSFLGSHTSATTLSSLWQLWSMHITHLLATKSPPFLHLHPDMVTLKISRNLWMSRIVTEYWSCWMLYTHMQAIMYWMA